MNTLLTSLRQKGYRLTTQRQQILSALSYTPLSVADVMDRLKDDHIHIDKVTVYRTLECFTDLGFVSKTQFGDNIAKFELLSPTKHHHHAVCTKCGAIEDICLNESSLLRKVKKLTTFDITSHMLEFFGICTKCQKGNI